MDMNTILKDKRYLFWTLQFAGWSGWAMSFYLGVIVWGTPPDNYLWYLPLIATIGMLLTLVLRSIYRYMWEMDLPRRIVAIVAGSYGAGLVWMAMRSTIFHTCFPRSGKWSRRKG